ncbi:MAG: pilus assembly PilX N-terminal domain-containing protein, partial [Candidatus Wildermuthbacteria bacterium]|nr:pilus assembly PilX N-terminal domain-containing protein [Candidatus Wildermuthbacteria bacterium]
MSQCLKFKNGFAAIYLTVLVLAAVFTITISISVVAYGENKISKNAVKSAQAYYAAEAGLEDAIYRIKAQKSISSNYTITVGSSSTSVLVSSPSQNNRIVTASTSIGNVSRKIEIRLSIAAVNPEFFYGAQVGDLGIKMENNSRIEGAGGTVGNIYSNGSVEGSPGATVTGTVFVATGMSQDQSDAVYNSDQILGKTNPIIDIAQSFKPGVSDALVKVSVYVKKVGDPGSVRARILTDSAGSPSKTVLASEDLEEDLVGTSYGWVDVVFSSPPNLAQGTAYWLMIDSSQDSNDYLYWGKDQNSGYLNGQPKYSQDWNGSSPNWTAIAGDMDFKTFMGGQPASLDGVIVIGDAHANAITNSKVCGNGYYQTIDSSSLNFLNNPSSPTCSSPLTQGTGYPGSQDPPLQNMPISDSNINQWKDDAAVGGVYSGNFSVTSSMSLGPKKINGNLIMTSNNKTLTVT